MIIRLAQTSDIPAITQLIDRSIRGIGSRYYRPNQIDSSLVHLFGVDSAMIMDGGYYVVTEGELTIGAGGWSARKTPFGGDQAADVRDASFRDPKVEPAVIRAFYVHPDYARKGVGRLLLETCEQAAISNGFIRFELVAILSGISFYEAMGYERQEPIDIPLPNGPIIESIRMTKENQ